MCHMRNSMICVQCSERCRIDTQKKNKKKTKAALNDGDDDDDDNNDVDNNYNDREFIEHFKRSTSSASQFT